ncbi:MAG: pentapeptide repeat-containing protein [Rhodospirillales bacterium]|nr:pentapeptide repeat-containing protein [Rhodospirillales bacterium]
MRIEANTEPVPATQVQTGVWFNVFTILGLLSVAFAVMFGAAFLEGWGVYTTIKEGHLKVEALRNLMLAAGAAGAVIAGVLGLALAAVRTHALNRQAKTAEREAEHSEKKHATETDLAQRRHQSEAFAKAIEQLGNEGSFAVNLGAVYALEALAKSSEELHGPIFETLCAYVREKAPAKGVVDLKQTGKDGKYIDDLFEPIDPPHVVVQAILTAIGRRDPKRDPRGVQLDLRNTNLRKADLKWGHFESANLRGARLERADLMGANLECASLDEACLICASLIETRLAAAFLPEADLTGANLEEANFEYAYLKDAHLDGVNLKDIGFNAQTNVSGASLLYSTAIPDRPGYNFYNTVQGADTATWPDDNDVEAWDRGDAEDDDKSD